MSVVQAGLFPRRCVILDHYVVERALAVLFDKIEELQFQLDCKESELNWERSHVVQKHLDWMVDRMVGVLNYFLEKDSEALGALMAHRVPSVKLAWDPDVLIRFGENGEAVVGFLEVLSAFTGVCYDHFGKGLITAVEDEAGKLVRFRRTDEGS